MLNINIASFSGKVLDIRKDGEGLMVLIEQKVNGQFDTVLAAFVTPSTKDAFLALGLVAGDTIAILEGQLYQKNDLPRLRISSLEQVLTLPDLPPINSIEFTGTVQQVEDVEGGKFVYLYQEVGGVMPTVFDVFVPTGRISFIESLNAGEDIYVKGKVYSKDGMIRIRAANETDFQKVQKEFFLGDEEARDKFI